VVKRNLMEVKMKRLAILLIIGLTSSVIAFDWNSLNPFNSLPTKQDARKAFESSSKMMELTQKGVKVVSFNTTKDIHKTSMGKEFYSIHFNAEIECTKNISHKCYKGVRDTINSGITYIKKNGKWVHISSDEMIWHRKAEITCLKMRDIKKRFDMYKLDNGSYPDSFDAVIREKHLESTPKDPWDTPFVYVGTGSKFDLISLGSDRQEGGQGKDISFIQHCQK
jgi:hypothetical protein